MTKSKSWTLTVVFAAFVGGSIIATAAPLTVSAAPKAPTAADCAKPILGFPVWYRGLVGPAPDCNLLSPNDPTIKGLSNFIWRIVLNVIEIGLMLAGYIAVGYILYGGFLFLTSQGSSEGSAKARKTILNAVIGLVISIASIAIVNLIMKVVNG